MQTGTMRLRELTVRYAVRKDREGQPIVVGRVLDRPSDAASALMTLLPPSMLPASRSGVGLFEML